MTGRARGYIGRRAEGAPRTPRRTGQRMEAWSVGRVCGGPVLSGPMTHLACVGGAALRCLLIASTALAALCAAAPPAGAAEADFGWSPDPAVVRQTTIFTAVQDPSITAYMWDLDGNGRYNDRSDASGPQVSRTFQNVRSYEVGLRVLDLAGNLTERRRQVTVVAPGGANQPPAASFVFFPANPVAGEPITFVSTSTDPDSPIPASGLRWDLNGDGAFDDAEGSSATTAYPVAGTYTVSLRITTNATDVAAVVLNVGAPGTPGTSVGQRALSLLSPFPVVRIAGRVSRRGARIRRLTDQRAPGHRGQGALQRSRVPVQEGPADDLCAGRRAVVASPRPGCCGSTARGPAAPAGRRAEAVRDPPGRGRQVHAVPDPQGQAAQPHRHVPGSREHPPSQLPLLMVDRSLPVMAILAVAVGLVLAISINSLAGTDGSKGEELRPAAPTGPPPTSRRCGSSPRDRPPAHRRPRRPGGRAQRAGRTSACPGAGAGTRTFPSSPDPCRAAPGPALDHRPPPAAPRPAPKPSPRPAPKPGGGGGGSSQPFDDSG